MAQDFPDAPAVDDEFTDGTNTWLWDGVKWTSGGGGSAKYLPLTGGDLTGPLTGTDATFSGIGTAGALAVEGPAGAVHGVYGKAGGMDRWAVWLGDQTPETGANNEGSHFGIQRYDDAGVLIDDPLKISRSGGTVELLHVLYAGPQVAINANRRAPDSYLTMDCTNSNGLLVNKNGLGRWTFQLGNSTAESGGNSGTNFAIGNIADDGLTWLGVPLQITRSSGIAAFEQTIVNGPSDRTMKENIAPLAGSLAKVEALQGVSFNFITTPDKPEIGLIAQDVEPVVPEIIQGFQTHDNQGRAAEMKMALDYPKLTALLIEAVKELSAKVTALEGGPAVNIETVNVRPSAPSRNGRRRAVGR
jgi:hypothetical protein